jgi:hypothetical protein
MILENQWEYLYNCACPAFPRPVREFYGHMIIVQDDDRGLILQTMVRGHTIQVDPQLISSVLGVPALPVLGVPFPLGVEAPNMDFLPLSDQYWCFCPYAPVLSKDSCDQLLATSSSKCAYSQEGHHSLCYCDEDTFLSVQAHFAHYALGSWWDKHQSVLWVFDHSHLSSVCDRYFWFWAQIKDTKSSWHTDSHEVQCSVAAWGSRWCSLASTSSGWHLSSCIIITGHASFLRHWSYFCSAYVFHGSSPVGSQSYKRIGPVESDWHLGVPEVSTPKAEWWWWLRVFITLFICFYYCYFGNNLLFLRLYVFV